MTDAYIFTGQILPERQRFGLEGQRLYVKDPSRGIDACLLFGVIDNQLTAKLTGKIEHLSNFMLKTIVSQAAQDIINSVAFTTGRLFELDLIGVVKDEKQRADGSVRFDYFDNYDEVISARKPSVTVQDIVALCISEDGIPVRRCLNDLSMALKEHADSPFYCYRALETIRGHLGNKRDETSDSKQWEVMREILVVDRADIDKVKKYADPLRHGTAVNFTGAEWREIISITWNIVEAYIRFLRSTSPVGQK